MSEVIGMDEAMTAELMRRAERTSELMEQLHQQNPDLPFVTCLVMANDMQGAEAAEVELRAGRADYEKALAFCGSYSRVDAALRWQQEGFATYDELLKLWPGMWMGSDPDDTDERYLQVWKDARARSGDVLIDEKPLDGGVFTVYRGQMPEEPFGIAWSLDEDVAGRFAGGVGMRASIDGVVYAGEIEREHVFGYLTGRGESEVVLNPEMLSSFGIVGSAR